MRRRGSIRWIIDLDRHHVGSGFLKERLAEKLAHLSAWRRCGARSRASERYQHRGNKDCEQSHDHCPVVARCRPVQIFDLVSRDLSITCLTRRMFRARLDATGWTCLKTTELCAGADGRNGQKHWLTASALEHAELITGVGTDLRGHRRMEMAIFRRFRGAASVARCVRFTHSVHFRRGD